MKLTEIVKSLALQSGVSETEIKTLLDNATIGSIEVDDAISNRLIAPRLSMDSAKANPELKKHFTAQALNGVDAIVERLMTESEFDDTAKAEITALDTTFKKVESVAKKIKEIEAKKATGSGDTVKLNKQLTELNAELLTAKGLVTAKETELNAKFATERVNWKQDSLLGSFSFALPKDTPKEAVIAFGRTITDKAILEKGLKVVDENGVLVLKTSENTDYFDNNVKVSYNDFVQKTLANAKVLSASPPAPPKKDEQHQHHNNGNQEVDLSNFNSALESSIADQNGPTTN